MDPNNIFCVLSLVGTFSVMKVVQDGLLRLADKYSKHR